MNQIDALTEENVAEVRETHHEVGQRCLRRQDGDGEVVHLEARDEVTDADPVGRVRMREDDDLGSVSTLAKSDGENMKPDSPNGPSRLGRSRERRYGSRPHRRRDGRSRTPC